MERWRRVIVLVALVALALFAALTGQLVLALPLAGIKAALVGVELMELRLAHRLHLFAYLVWAATVTIGSLVWLTRV